MIISNEGVLHYLDHKYDSKERFMAYWHQIDEILKYYRSSVLEIGIGNKFVGNYLNSRGINYRSIDIDVNLNPELVGSIFNLPFKNNIFDLSACFEVLEHWPYNYFKNALLELKRVSKYNCILSIPDSEKYYKFDLLLPKIGEIKKGLTLCWPKNRKCLNGTPHYWEIGLSNISLHRVIIDITECGFEIVKTFRLFENYYHRMFILSVLT